MGVVKEFRDFAVKGNVVDLAVGVIIGAAFGKIVSSLVGDIMMPILGILMKGVSFENLTVKVGDAVVKYGVFLQTVVDFLIVAFCVFMFVKAINKMKKKHAEAPAAPAPPTASEVLLTEIRDLLKK